ncbi:phage holin family protein [Flavobacterium silvaticum]|uniref:Phage holin family protein n=1 Tax=Flavobacterium silvaticum TaxID=1852020 RepID=A0A972JIE1_9FLAO|nr:phage holin family protein [Flavobacterium silvaticum]NMH28920.1 phage holin family protein [Flavobacterium silvaticum]
MQDKIEIVKDLAQKAEEFAKTNIELYKLKAIDKGTDVFSSVASAIIISLIFVFFVTMISFGIALWIGESLGHLYYGFLIVAGFYLLIGIILIVTKESFLENFLNDYIVRLIFKEKDNEGAQK